MAKFASSFAHTSAQVNSLVTLGAQLNRHSGCFNRKARARARRRRSERWPKIAFTDVKDHRRPRREALKNRCGLDKRPKVLERVPVRSGRDAAVVPGRLDFFGLSRIGDGPVPVDRLG